MLDCESRDSANETSTAAADNAQAGSSDAGADTVAPQTLVTQLRERLACETARLATQRSLLEDIAASKDRSIAELRRELSGAQETIQDLLAQASASAMTSSARMSTSAESLARSRNRAPYPEPRELYPSSISRANVMARRPLESGGPLYRSPARPIELDIARLSPLASPFGSVVDLNDMDDQENLLLELRARMRVASLVNASREVSRPAAEPTTTPTPRRGLFNWRESATRRA